MAKKPEFRIGGGKYLCLSCGHTQNALIPCKTCDGDWLYRRVKIAKKFASKRLRR